VIPISFLVCSKCPTACSITTGGKEIRPIFCGILLDGILISPEWLEPVIEAGPKTAEQLRKEREALTKFKLRDEK